jgi:hypothetical protein
VQNFAFCGKLPNRIKFRTNGIFNVSKLFKQVHLPTMRINRFYIHKNCTVARGIRTRVTPATERGQSFNEHGYQAGASINVTLLLYAEHQQITEFWERFGVCADISMICQCQMFHKNCRYYTSSSHHGPTKQHTMCYKIFDFVQKVSLNFPDSNVLEKVVA